MVESLLHPLNIFIVGLGGGFLLPILYRIGKSWVPWAFVVALMAMTVISGVALFRLLHGAPPIDILTGGATPPLSINLRLGVPEAVFALSVNLIALGGALYFVRETYASMILYLLIVIGIQGMVMTRDLFNLFVFLEIVSVATYGLLSLRDTPAALAATFKYIMATVLASTFFLIGTTLLYAVTGILNIDDLIAVSGSMSGPIAYAALTFLLACLLLELKPFPANGWGLDVYETARSDVAAMISGGVSAGVLFSFLKLLPLFKDQLEVIAVLGAATFLFSNLIGLRQTKAQRLLGYSSVGQMALLTMAAALLRSRDADYVVPLVVGGLFVNHLFAKVGLFWLAGYVGKEELQDWSVLRAQPGALLLFGVLLVAISGLPPFPGFWAKWRLIMSLAAGERYVWITIVLVGSLLEAAYMFRWFGRALHGVAPLESSGPIRGALSPVAAMALLLATSGYVAAVLAGLSSAWVLVPIAAGLVLYLCDALPEPIKCAMALALLFAGGLPLLVGLPDLSYLFGVILFAGSLAILIACFSWPERRPGFFSLLTAMLLSVVALPRASTSLEFFFIWEFITLSSYFLILRRPEAASHALGYLLFSLASAFFILAGFAVMQAQSGSVSLVTLREAGANGALTFVLLTIGLMIKAGAIGVHVWLPDAYAEAEDDVSAFLSAVVSKAPMFGLLVGAYLAIRAGANLGLTHLMGWLGMLTTLAGAIMAVRQDDMKRMLAYSSMSQIGYIVAAIALMSHLGWVTALYLVANHMLVKGILFLVAAAIIMRTGKRMLADLGGLAGAMPLTFAAAAVAMVAMSGLPPLAGFGGKWLLLSAMMEKGWYAPAIMTLLATFVGFLYMARFIQVIFLGPRKAGLARVTEAPRSMLLAQYLLIAGILLMSFFPKLLIEPVSRAMDPQFASTLVWQGMSLELIYGYWNPMPAMAFAVALSAILFAILWQVRRSSWLRLPNASSSMTGTRVRANFYDDIQPIFVALTPPWAAAFWDGAAAATTMLGDRVRLIYNGNGQWYNMLMLYYVLVLYAAELPYGWPRGG